jgi:hypothetical protein
MATSQCALLHLGRRLPINAGAVLPCQPPPDHGCGVIDADDPSRDSCHLQPGHALAADVQTEAGIQSIDALRAMNTLISFDRVAETAAGAAAAANGTQ